MDYFNNIIIQAVFENIKILFSLLNFLAHNNDSNLSVNSLCPCGSLSTNQGEVNTWRVL